MTPPEHLRLANSYVDGLPPDRNTFGTPARLSYQPMAAMTMCSSFATLLLRQSYALTDRDWTATMVRSRPNATDYNAAISQGRLPRVHDLFSLKPGDILSIAYGRMRNGFSGHTAIIASAPVDSGATFEGHAVLGVAVIDSCRSSHGPGDTRFTAQGEKGGIGKGGMRLVVARQPDGTGKLHGYFWSLREASEFARQGDGASVLFGRVPDTWKRHDAATLAMIPSALSPESPEPF